MGVVAASPAAARQQHGGAARARAPPFRAALRRLFGRLFGRPRSAFARAARRAMTRPGIRSARSLEYSSGLPRFHSPGNQETTKAAVLTE